MALPRRRERYCDPISRPDSVKRSGDGRSHRLDFEWNNALGTGAVCRGAGFRRPGPRAPSGRIDGVIAPSQIETCSEELIQEAVAEARSRGMRITIHAAQTMAEHEELLRRTGETAPAMLERLGRAWAGSDPRALHLSRSPFLDAAPHAGRPRATWRERAPRSRIAPSPSRAAA